MVKKRTTLQELEDKKSYIKSYTGHTLFEEMQDLLKDQFTKCITQTYEMGVQDGIQTERLKQQTAKRHKKKI